MAWTGVVPGLMSGGGGGVDSTLCDDEAERINGFAHSLNLSLESLDFMWQLPADVQQKVIGSFDPSGTKDGNVLGRLRGYASALARRNGISLDFSESTPNQSMPAPSQRTSPAGGSAPWLAQEPYASAEAPAAQSGQEDVDPEMLRYLSSVGLDDANLEYLMSLPVELRSAVLDGFEAEVDSEEGINVRFFLHVVNQWCWSLSLEEPVISFVRTIPEEILRKAICKFDPSGTKDGNVPARLHKYLEGLCSRAGVNPGDAAGRSGTASEISSDHDVPGFLDSLGIMAEQSAKFQALPKEVQHGVVLEFDPSGTKDGNVWGRLVAFAHRVARRVGCSPQVVSQLQILRDAARGVVPSQPRGGFVMMGPPSISMPSPLGHAGPYSTGHGARGTQPSLQAFAAHWGLDESMVNFLEALPSKVSSAVLTNFDGTATKDGNIWARLLPYCRVQWAKSFGIDRHVSDMLKALPEEAQMACMKTFDPTEYKASEVHEELRNHIKILQEGGDGGHWDTAVAKSINYEGANGFQGRYSGSTANEGDNSNEGEIGTFLEAIGVEPAAAGDLLTELPPELLERVFNEFDPSGTKDGNVLGRLRGFVRSLLRRRGSTPQESGRNVRARVWTS
eukprot:TRINITY_DN51431_c0_g1_i1.p1 TRINITY_DN51431_c0_g1~~TRINITY_DN51431_c0_g1_i1.p1  ORF type:complete len:619 (+),score=130.06 TRINITY_DN51431_c0_g1_i1:134-1990(+)